MRAVRNSSSSVQRATGALKRDVDYVAVLGERRIRRILTARDFDSAVYQGPWDRFLSWSCQDRKHEVIHNLATVCLGAVVQAKVASVARGNIFRRAIDYLFQLDKETDVETVMVRVCRMKTAVPRTAEHVNIVEPYKGFTLQVGTSLVPLETKEAVSESERGMETENASTLLHIIGNLHQKLDIICVIAARCNGKKGEMHDFLKGCQNASEASIFGKVAALKHDQMSWKLLASIAKWDYFGARYETEALKLRDFARTLSRGRSGLVDRLIYAMDRDVQADSRAVDGPVKQAIVAFLGRCRGASEDAIFLEAVEFSSGHTCCWSHLSRITESHEGANVCIPSTK